MHFGQYKCIIKLAGYKYPQLIQWKYELRLDL